MFCIAKKNLSPPYSAVSDISVTQNRVFCSSGSQLYFIQRNIGCVTVIGPIGVTFDDVPKNGFESFRLLYRLSIVPGDVLRQCLLINNDVGTQEQLYLVIFKDLVDSCGTPYH